MEKEYVKLCPKCGSDMTKLVFDKKLNRIVSKCYNCMYKGDTIFEDIEKEKALLIKARKYKTRDKPS